ncbi:MAG: hypothetical protein V3T72_14320 [Thermoanaerobaculia bacterium]
MPLRTDPWVLETFAERRVTEGGDTAKAARHLTATIAFVYAKHA